MTWLRSLSVRWQLLAAFAVVALLGAVSSTIGVTTARRLAASNRATHEHMTVPVAELADIVNAFQRQRVNLRDVILADSRTDGQPYAARIDSLHRVVDSVRALFEKSVVSETMRRHVGAFQTTYAAFVPLRDSVIALGLAQQDQAAIDLMRGAANVAQQRVVAQIDTMQQLKVTQAFDSATADAHLAARAQTILAVVGVLALVLALTVGALFARRLTTMLHDIGDRAERLRDVCVTQLNQGLQAVARGDVSVDVFPTTRPLVVTSGDELGQLATTINTMIDQTQQTIVAYNAARAALTTAVGQTTRVVTAVAGGRLDERADPGTLVGVYRELLVGTNDAIEAIVAPMRASTAALERLAQRDLTAHVDGTYLGDHARVQDAVNAAVAALAEALGHVRQSSEQVAAAGSQIATGSESLAAGASEQAASLEEISASVQELASMAARTSENTREGRSLATQSRTRAAEGAVSMERLAVALAEIRDSAAQTAKVVKTIDEIAFQTNLLALNAAVEAARAGDAGRGFAVVAEEVRALALRAAAAARHTSDIIERSHEQAVGGAALGEVAHAQFRDLERGVVRTTEMIAEIAAAAEQQAEGVSQINTALEQMSGVTQQAAAQAEESASAAAQLSAEAGRLQDVVGEFTLDVVEDVATRSASGRLARAAVHDAGHSPAPRRRKPVRSGR